ELREADDVLEGAVPPADVVAVLLGTVLSVVDEEIGSRRELVARRPLGSDWKLHRAERGLVVRQIRDDSVATRDSISDPWPGMAKEQGGNAKFSDLEFAARHFVELQPAGKLPQAHGKERWRQISVEPLRKCERGASRPPDLDLHPWIVKRRKEAESLNVVHVQ